MSTYAAKRIEIEMLAIKLYENQLHCKENNLKLETGIADGSNRQTAWIDLHSSSRNWWRGRAIELIEGPE